MKSIKVYYTALIISAVFFLMYWFAPWGYQYLAQEKQSLLSYHSYGSVIGESEYLYWGFFSAMVIGYVGMLLFRKLFRLWFVSLIVISLILSPLFGMSIITGIEVFIIDTSTILSGFVIALAYFTPLKDKFY
jgi:hypothetical protein